MAQKQPSDDELNAKYGWRPDDIVITNPIKKALKELIALLTKRKVK